MKNWVKALISSIIFFLISCIWEYVTLKEINWLEIIITTIVFGIIEFIFYIICEKYAKKKKEK